MFEKKKWTHSRSRNQGFWATLSEYNKEEEEVEGFDESLSLEDQLTKVNEMGLLKAERKGSSAAFDQLFLNVRTLRAISRDFVKYVIS